MNAPCDSLSRFIDDELDDREAADFRQHLGVCPVCPPRLEQAFLLDEMVEEVMRKRADEPASGRPVDDLARLRRRRNAVLAVGGLAAAACALLVPGWLDRSPAPELLALGTSYRSIDGQLGYRGLEGHRPLVRERGAGVTPAPGGKRERTLARLEQAGDHHGLAVAALIAGRLDEAARQFEQAPPTPLVLADRAALALARNDPGTALTLSERALRDSPGLPAALWNRAVALDRLGRPGEAAAVFRAVAASGQPGWGEEASRRAAGLAGGLPR